MEIAMLRRRRARVTCALLLLGLSCAGPAAIASAWAQHDAKAPDRPLHVPARRGEERTGVRVLPARRQGARPERSRDLGGHRP